MHKAQKNVRFKSATNQYLTILHSDKPEVYMLDDIRKLYDEIKEDELPDGKLFRKAKVSVQDRGSGEKVHEGNTDEDEDYNKRTKKYNRKFGRC